MFIMRNHISFQFCRAVDRLVPVAIASPSNISLFLITSLIQAHPLIMAESFFLAREVKPLEYV